MSKSLVKLTFEPRWLNKITKAASVKISTMVRRWNKEASVQFKRAIQETLASDQELSAYAGFTDAFKVQQENLGHAKTSGTDIRISGKRLLLTIDIGKASQKQLIKTWGHDGYWKFMAYSFGRSSFMANPGPKGLIPIRGSRDTATSKKTYRRTKSPHRYQNRVAPSDRTGVSFVKPRIFPAFPVQSDWVKRAKLRTVIRVNRMLKKRMR
jgi:hypothetical protein